MAFIFYLGMVLTFLTPFIVFRALVWYPLTMKTLPYSYLFGIFLMSGVFSLYYRSFTGDKRWYYGFLYSYFYSLILNWQMFYALVTLRDQKWGTR
jgi:hyaluronan synthase